MAFSEISVIDKIEVIESKHVQVRVSNRVLKDGEQITSTYHRHVIAPGDDYSNEDPDVQAICALFHTPEVIAAYQAAQEPA